MTDKLSIAAHAFASRLLMSVSVDIKYSYQIIFSTVVCSQVFLYNSNNYLIHLITFNSLNYFYSHSYMVSNNKL